MTPVAARTVVGFGPYSISYEPSGGTVRILLDNRGGEQPPYTAVGDVTRITLTICKLSGFAGTMRRPHMLLIAQLLLGLGYKLAYIERAAGRTMPGATRIRCGDFKGWWRLDLSKVDLSRIASKQDGCLIT